MTESQLQRLAGKIATLERRADHLQRQADEGQRGSAYNFIRAELAALDAAIVALRLHHAEVEALQTPIAVLEELIAVLEKRDDLGKDLTGLLERASVAVLEFATAKAGQEGKEKEHDQRNEGRGTRPAW